MNSLTISRRPAGAVNGGRWHFGEPAAKSPPFMLCFALRYGKICDNSHLISISLAQNGEITVMTLDDKTRTELEAAVFRRLVEHLRSRTDVQNIDLMNLAGFCRNCLSNWLKDEADAKGVGMSKDESREAVYGMPYETWKSTHQGTASAEQLAAMKKAPSEH